MNSGPLVNKLYPPVVAWSAHLPPCACALQGGVVLFAKFIALTTEARPTIRGEMQLTSTPIPRFLDPYHIVGNSREKTSMNFEVLWLFTKVFSAKVGGVVFFVGAECVTRVHARIKPTLKC